MITNFSIVESECDFGGVKRTRTAIQYRRAPTIDVRVRRCGTQCGFSRGLVHSGSAKRSRCNRGVQVEGSRFRVVSSVSVDDLLSAVAEFLTQQPVNLFHVHAVHIGAVESAYGLMEI